MNKWDGKWYEKIVTQGYEYQRDGRPHDIAFFPLYPFLTWVLMGTGLGFAAAGTIVSNTAFLGALYLLYQRTAEHYGHQTARWAVAALAWFPLSVFCFVTYAEALFLPVTLGFLQAFEKQYYWLAALLAALAALCRIPGMTLIPAIVVCASWDRLPWRAYLPALFGFLGIATFVIYQATRFHDPLAFVHMQASWMQNSFLVELPRIHHPINLMRIFVWPAAVVLLYSLRRKLCRLDLAYALCSLLLILLARNMSSGHRYVFGIAPVFAAAGLWFRTRPRIATVFMVLSAAGLLLESVAWAWYHFIG